MSLLIVVLLGMQPAPPPIAQHQANCRSPTYATDMLVCSDYDLRSRDAEMGALITRVGAVARAGLKPFIEPQAAWFQRRSRCAFEADHRQCTADAYEERTIVLLMLLEPEDADAPRYRCTGNGSAAGLTGQILRNRALVLSAKGKRIGVALQRFKHSNWRPHVLLEGTLERPEIRPPDDSRRACALVR